MERVPPSLRAEQKEEPSPDRKEEEEEEEEDMAQSDVRRGGGGGGRGEIPGPPTKTNSRTQNRARRKKAGGRGKVEGAPALSSFSFYPSSICKRNESKPPLFYPAPMAHSRGVLLYVLSMY